MLVIHGGRVNLEAASYYREIYYIGTFWIFCGRDDFRFEAGDNGIASAEAYLKLPAANHIAARDNEDADFHYDESENKDREELFRKYNKYFSYNGSDITDVVSGNIYDWTWTLCTTAIGANWIANIFDEYLAPAPEDVKLAYTSKIWLYSVSFGEFNIESKLDEVVKTGWFSAFCSVHQFGESSSTRMSMNIVD